MFNNPFFKPFFLRACKFKKIREKKGFTLLELMIVLVIIAGVAFILVPTIFSKSNRELRSEIRRFSLMSKEIRNQALLRRATFRLVFDVEPKTHYTRYWVDAAQDKILIDDPEERLKFIKDRQSFDEDEELAYQQKNPFKLDKKFTSEKGKEFPGSLRVKKIQLQGIKEDFTEGEIAIHFFPEGLVELAVVQIESEDEGLKWTLATSPLTGAIDVFEGHLELKDIENQQ